MNKSTLFILVCCLLSFKAFSQGHLHKRISIHARDMLFVEVLEQIEQKAGFQFSYSTSVIELHATRVNLKAEDKEVKYILDKLIRKELNYIERGSFVIIQEQPDRHKRNYKFEGRIYDSRTKQPIEGVSVFPVNSNTSRLTSEKGNYKVEFKDDRSTVHLAYSRKNYRDTVIVVPKNHHGPIDIQLSPIVDSSLFVEQGSLVDSLKLVKLITRKEVQYHMENMKLFRRRMAQVSFLPVLGTNGMLSGKTQNRISLNLIAGYEHSLEGFEAGGFANITRYHVNGVQLAGFGNIAGRYTNGFQAAGGFNINKGEVNGVQLSGFFNAVIDSFHGFQASGFANVGSFTKGVQASGFVNTSWAGSKAWQLSGFVNYSKFNTGVQATGFTNFALQYQKGTQLAGLANFAGSSKGLQAAGLANFSWGKVEGLQIAGLFNMARELKGLQIGLINVTDTVHSGAMIGLLSFARKGLLETDLSYSEISPLGLRLKTGTDQFYNIISASYLPEQELIYTGYGIGNRRTYANGFTRGIELEAGGIRKNWLEADQLNALGTIYPFLAYRFGKHALLNAGPTFRVYVNQYQNPDTGEYGFPVMLSPFYNVTDNGTNVQMSFGYRIALSI